MSRLKITIREGNSLWEELCERNIVIHRPCGGNGTCGGCTVTLSDGKKVRSCQYRTAGEVLLMDVPPAGNEPSFDGIAEGEEAKKYYAKAPVVVVDLGTTTVVGRAFLGDEQKCFHFVNPQRTYGADVMSRIRAATDGAGMKLKQLIENALYTSIMETFSTFPEWKKEMETQVKLIVSGNTTMQHLLEGSSCESLGHAPFEPGDIFWHEFDFPISQDSFWRGCMLPGISAFVGADIVSGLFYLNIMNKDKPCLFIDLGTNGELALGCRERLLVSSASAGPAFEGSALACEIYGAGVLQLIHRLRREQVIDAYGTLTEPYFTEGYPVGRLCLTQDDIRELQMAKAAVYAGIQVLLMTWGITPEEVETVYLAGGFGYYLNPEDALGIGLLPEAFRGKIQAVSNTSLAGAVTYMKDPKQGRAVMEEICAEAELVSLLDCPDFEAIYIEAMNFM